MKRAVQSIPTHAEVEGNDPPKTLAEAVYRRFRQDILWGKLAPGAPLRSDELKRTYNVGISPLREALSRLASERLVTLSGQRGFRVAPLTADDVIDTMETRLVIESEALTRSIHPGSIPWETRLVGSFHALSRIDVPEGPGEHAEIWAKHHRDFHMALLAGCGSSWLNYFAGSLFDQAERHRILTINEAEGDRDAAGEHRRIMEAALSGNIKAAVAALDYHYRTTAEVVVRTLNSRAPVAGAEVARLKRA
jgi:GntR family carbon starvation induced transcriptional regulator